MGKSQITSHLFRFAIRHSLFAIRYSPFAIFPKECLMLKVGIVGMGTMGWFHASRILQLPNAQLVAIADSMPERLEAKKAWQDRLAAGGRPYDLARMARYADASALIAQADVDVVDICLPTFLHARYAIEALQAGRHVLCEKPMALTVEQADQMIAAAQRVDRLLMVAQCIRFWPEYTFLRQQVCAETYGKLLSLNMYRMGGRPQWSWENWFLDVERSGGTILDLHIHDVPPAPTTSSTPATPTMVARRSTSTPGGAWPPSPSSPGSTPGLNGGLCATTGGTIPRSRSLAKQDPARPSTKGETPMPTRSLTFSLVWRRERPPQRVLLRQYVTRWR
jgi:hypothetical protein